MSIRVVFAVLLLLNLSCQGPLEGLQAPAIPEETKLSVVGEGDVSDLPPVFRLDVQLLSERTLGLEPSALVLFQGELGSYHRGRVTAAELPSTLEARRAPVSVWSRESAFRLQPLSVLDEGVYTVALLGWGVVGQIAVRGSTLPVLWRQWPKVGVTGGARGALYCAESPVEVTEESVPLAPDDEPARWGPSPIDSERCLEVRVDGTPSDRIPPPEVGGALVEPEPLAVPSRVDPLEQPSSCEPPARPLGPGCIWVGDDRLTVWGPEQAAFWWLSIGGTTHGMETVGGSAFVIGGLQPESSVQVSGVVYDLLGESWPLDEGFFTSAPTPHVAINEVYADAQGPEPEQEWVEIVNSGVVPVGLAGWALEDVGGAASLPEVTLQPGQFAVLVNESYQPDADYDLVVPPSTLIIRLPELARQGLSNSGELLRLRDGDGDVVSKFPPRQARRGVSQARRFPWSLDTESDAFGPHADPGASPGAPNALLDSTAE